MAVYRTLARNHDIPSSLQEQSNLSDDSVFTVQELEGIDGIVGQLLDYDSDEEVILRNCLGFILNFKGKKYMSRQHAMKKLLEAKNRRGRLLAVSALEQVKGKRSGPCSGKWKDDGIPSSFGKRIDDPEADLDATILPGKHFYSRDDFNFLRRR
jgi:hypothetical protein